jgi:hypothetical protein
VPAASTSQAGVVQLAGSIGATVASENDKAASEKAVRDAINALDVDDLVNSASGGAGKTLATLSEADGKISATFQDIEITTSQISDLSTALSAKADKVTGALSGNFAGLDTNGNLTDSGKKASDFKTVQTAVSDPTVPSTGTTDSLSFIDTISQDTNGVITATKKNVKVADTYSGTGTDPVNGKAVKAAIDALAAEVTSSDGTNVQVKVTEAGGKVTAVNITTDNSIGGVKLDGAANALTPAGNNNEVTIPNAVATGTTGATNGLMTADDKAKLNGIAAGAQVNVIESVKANGTALTIDADKAVNIPEAGSSTYGVVTVTTIEL